MEQKPLVSVFNTPGCSYCHALMDYLDSKNIDYVSIDLTREPDKAQEMMQKSGQTGVPVTIIKIGDQEKVIVGFVKEDIDRILEVHDQST
jgi:glutaredoxin